MHTSSSVWLALMLPVAGWLGGYLLACLRFRRWLPLVRMGR
jgi:hypothetical protein